MKSKTKFEDDGRQIADMSGTYESGLGGFVSFRRSKNKKKKEKDEEKKEIQESPLTKRETRKLMFNAMLAGLLVGAVFIVFALIFVLFSIFVWFK